MRDRLAEIYHNIEIEYLDYLTNITERAIDGDIEDKIQQRQQFYVDKLLENGVIVPPCKVGDTVCYLNKHLHISLFQNSVYKAKVVRIVTTSLGTSIVIQIKSEGCCEVPEIYDWGKTLFATREEAERTLKGGVQE